MSIEKRRPEKDEVFNDKDAKAYATGCDFKEGIKKTSDYAIVAAEAARMFGTRGRLSGLVVEVCPGPGNLCGELIKKGAQKVIGIDASETMLDHATKKFEREIAQGRIEFKKGWAQKLPINDGIANGSINFHSFHQFKDDQRAFDALKDMVRILTPSGWGFVRDFRRDVPTHIMDRFLKKRTAKTPEVAELLRESLGAAFTRDEFIDMLKKIDGIKFSVENAQDPRRILSLLPAIALDPVPHWMDSMIDQNVKIQKLR